MHPMLECNPARDVQVKFFCVRLWLVTLYLLSLHCTWMTNSCLFHTGGKTSFAGSFVSHKRVEDGTCISVTVSASSWPLSIGGGVMFGVVSHYSPQKALWFFSGVLAHRLVSVTFYISQVSYYHHVQVDTSPSPVHRIW